MSSIMKPEKISVRTEGTLVVLQIGNVDLKFEYETAIQLSTWMRVHGKAAKRAAGDNARRWNVVGNLTAIEHGERPFR